MLYTSVLTGTQGEGAIERKERKGSEETGEEKEEESQEEEGGEDNIFIYHNKDKNAEASWDASLEREM